MLSQSEMDFQVRTIFGAPLAHRRGAAIGPGDAAVFGMGLVLDGGTGIRHGQRSGHTISTAPWVRGVLGTQCPGKVKGAME